MEKKQKNDNRSIWITFSIIIFVAGIIIALKGFAVGLDYAPNRTIRFDIEEEKTEQAKDIIKETFYYKEVKIQDIEGEGNIKLITRIITQEEKEELINKLNEKLDLKLSSEDVIVEENSQIRLRDLLKNYLKAIIIVTIILLIYIPIVYRKFGVYNVISETLTSLVLSQIFVLTVLAITRYKIDNTIISMLAIVYICAVYTLTNEYEKRK